MLTFEKMKPSEWKECAALAARAFYDYEYFAAYVTEDERRHRFLDALLRCEFKANKSLPTVHFITAKENGHIVAVGQLCAPDFKKPGDWAYVCAGWLGVLRRGGSKDVNAWNAMEPQASAPCHALHGNTWYLSLLTVASSEEGKGIGSRFVQEGLLPYAREHGAEAVSLFTNSEPNRRFYLKNGFEVFDERRFEHNGRGFGSWSFIRRF
ncbi:MAG: GNAT family N-acetyltransferase [Clostridia bacterium]|nr:GNAT family N-acetyltransferase [Clostridia bacterium]